MTIGFSSVLLILFEMFDSLTHRGMFNMIWKVFPLQCNKKSFSFFNVKDATLNWICAEIGSCRCQRWNCMSFLTFWIGVFPLQCNKKVFPLQCERCNTWILAEIGSKLILHVLSNFHQDRHHQLHHHFVVWELMSHWPQWYSRGQYSVFSVRYRTSVPQVLSEGNVRGRMQWVQYSYFMYEYIK